MADQKKDDEKKGFFDKLEETIFPHERKREEEKKDKERSDVEAEQARKARQSQAEVQAKAEQARKARERAQQERQQPGAGFGSGQPGASGNLPNTGGAASQVRKHTVKKDETLSHIALKYYGSATKEHWMKIYQANKQIIGDNPNIIRTGQELIIP